MKHLMAALLFGAAAIGVVQAAEKEEDWRYYAPWTQGKYKLNHDIPSACEDEVAWQKSLTRPYHQGIAWTGEAPIVQEYPNNPYQWQINCIVTDSYYAYLSFIPQCLQGGRFHPDRPDGCYVDCNDESFSPDGVAPEVCKEPEPDVCPLNGTEVGVFFGNEFSVDASGKYCVNGCVIDIPTKPLCDFNEEGYVEIFDDFGKDIKMKYTGEKCDD